MALNTVTITWDETDIGQGGLNGSIRFAPNTTWTDTLGSTVIEPQPLTFPVLDSAGQTTPLVANDSAGLLPSGSYYVITVQIAGLPPRQFSAYINFANGSSQTLGSLNPLVTVPAQLAYLPLPSGGAPAAGQVPSALGDGSQNTEWGTGGGSGTVTSVSVATANGFAGTVASPGTTPAITVKTSVTGLLKGNGTAISAASAGTDYLAPAGSGAALTGITAAQAGADAAGSAATAQSNAEAYALSAAYAGATVLVAASNASAKAKAAAAFVCTGTGDNVTIDSAIAALPAEGGTVLLSEGTYTLADSILITSSDVRLIGSGPGTLVKITGAVTHLHIISAAGSSGSPLSGICVGALTVMGYGDNQNSGALAMGVSLSWCNDSTVQDIWGHDVTWAVVSLNDCQRCAVDKVHIEAGTLGVSGGWYGVSVYNGDIAGFYAGHVISNITSQAPHHAIAMQSVSHAAVSNVTAMNMADTAGDPYVLNWQGCDNITAVNIVGINVPGLFYVEETCDKCSLTSFTIIASQSAGEDVIFGENSTNIMISDGYIDATAAETFDAVQFTGTCDHVTVSGVNVNGSPRYGINMLAADSLVSGCTVKGTTLDGIWVNAANCRVTGNHAESCGGNGIRDSGHFTVVTGNVLLSNTGSGLLLDFGSFSVVDDNQLISNTAWGINISQSNTTSAVIGMGNVYSSNGSGTITDSGTTTVRNDIRFAALASPALTGTPTAPTASALTSTTQLATTAYADSAVGVEKTRALAAEALLAPLADLPWMPSDNGLLVANGELAAFSNTGTPVAGTLYLIRLTARVAITISNLWFGVNGNSSGTSTGSFGGLYSSAGTKLTGSSDVLSLFNSSNGFAEVPLTTPQAVAAGSFVWAALLLNIGTMPSLYQGAGGNTAFTEIGLTVSTARWATNGTSLTALPPSVTPSSNAFIQRTFWCGAS